MNKHIYNQTDEQKKIDAAASGWVDLVLAHIRAKRLTEMKSVKTNKKDLKQLIHQN